MTVGLALLVRDEEATIERAIRKALPIIDHVTILDTGSTDGTQRELWAVAIDGVLIAFEATEEQ